VVVVDLAGGQGRDGMIGQGGAPFRLGPGCFTHLRGH
jgi:hypothetical protein